MPEPRSRINCRSQKQDEHFDRQWLANQVSAHSFLEVTMGFGLVDGGSDRMGGRDGSRQTNRAAMVE